jgi:hypothetical protein
MSFVADLLLDVAVPVNLSNCVGLGHASFRLSCTATANTLHLRPWFSTILASDAVRTARFRVRPAILQDSCYHLQRFGTEASG